jgi:diguanylate cyclase (GGDEF)-like protein
MATSEAAAGAAMCPVDSPDHCPAARRAQVQHFADSEALDACPKLRNRSGGRCSAVCVPVSIMGRTVGVLHATGEVRAQFSEGALRDLGTLAKLAGARMGMLRLVADSQLQAATDSLTGLLNRRSLENEFRAMRERFPTMSVVMADLDHFKQLNDTYGHDTGDRALRLFARTVTTSLRAVDVVGRHGGEEFAILLPGCAAGDAGKAIEQVRDGLAAAVGAAGLPAFTASFGAVQAEPQESLSDMLARADNALFEAKRTGRDRIVVHLPAEAAVAPVGRAALEAVI